MNMSYDEFKALQEKIDAIARDEPLPQVNEDSNHKIIMGFIDQWIEAGQPKDYMADLVAYVKKTIPDSKNWNYAASLINDGVKSYQDREYGTSSLMGLRGKSMDEDNEYGFQSWADEEDEEPGTYIYSGFGSGTYYSVSGEKVWVSPQEASAMAEKEGVKFRYIDALDKRSIVAVKDSKTEPVEEAVAGGGVDDLYELLDMGISKENLFDEWVAYSSSDDIAEFVDHFKQMYDV